MKIPIKIFIFLAIVMILIVSIFNLNKPYLVLSDDTFISPTQGSIKITSRLYYVYDKALRYETIQIKVVDGKYEQAIIEALKAGSDNDSFKSLFDQDVEVISVENVNNTCYINFSSSITETEIWKDESIQLYIWSMVNSLTELKRVLRVQIMLEGNPITNPILGQSLSKPLTRDETLIYTKDRTASDAAIDFIDYMNSGRYDLSYSLLSENTKVNMDYSGFIKYANEFMEETKGFSRTTYFTKSMADEWFVFVKFVKDYEGDGFQIQLYDKWRVIMEEGSYRVELEH
ncbi:MAG: GerMN domain-containing protein [Bacillota bacterium]|nr:GerMN domain-containing protein [Bacillota bacterium]